MQISVELTLSPLQDNFESTIRDFIFKLKHSGFTILENPLSTQIYGDYDKVMEFLQVEIKDTFENLDNVLISIKIVKSNRRNYATNI
ncbi:MAG TPA: thiamine-binding protein [Salinimicrobium sp.]|nr:thiamine-binding protein [Salinimicrobium sp.]